jgi:dGTPase
VPSVSKNALYTDVDQERRHQESPRSARDIRGPFERDYGRIIHSAAFRRLQSKTQVLGVEAGDFHRTRLTHSLEVAQIARGIAAQLNRTVWQGESERQLDLTLIEAAALAHDLGHPPFGHQGERALNCCMRQYGGFEGNAHTFRLLTRLEGKRGEGLNLTRGLLLSVIKYPVRYDQAVKLLGSAQRDQPPKSSVFSCDREVFEWLLSPYSPKEQSFFQEQMPAPKGCRLTRHLTLECSIIELADDIAYATHDLEDAISLGWVEPAELAEQLAEWGHLPEELRNASALLRGPSLKETDAKHRLKNAIAYLISGFVTRVSVESQGEEGYSPRFRYRAVLEPEWLHFIERLKKIVKQRVIDSPPVQATGWKGERVVRLLFDAFRDEVKLLPESDRMIIQASPEDKERIICDYIAGMTDQFALKWAQKLYGNGPMVP